VSETQGIGEGRPRGDKDSATALPSTNPVQDAIREAIAQWKSQGIQDWEILDVWANLAHQQGNYAIADTLESAAYELGKPIE
jgi:hypothetical protein